MPPKSKLTDAQWLDVFRRSLKGESTRDIAKDYGVSNTTIHNRVSLQCKDVKDVANSILATECKVSRLSPTLQIEAINYAHELKEMSSNMLGAGRASSATSKKLAAMAEQMAIKLEYRDNMTVEEIETQLILLKSVVALQSTANSANVIPASLLAMNKAAAEKIIPTPDPEESDIPSGLGFLYGE